jgi:hypothetical protein
MMRFAAYYGLYNEKSIYSDFFLFSFMGWENIATVLFHFPVTTVVPVYFPVITFHSLVMEKYFPVTSDGKVLSSH